MVQQFSATEINYPDSDGQPMADNTKQFRWITTIQGGLDALFAGRNDVFVAGDLLWYPVEGEPNIRCAPDVLVVFGRSKGDRGSYRQWEEDNISPQVVFEILSPGNRTTEMLRKLGFYSRYGVQEYYLYDPERGDLLGWQRQENYLEEIPKMRGWVSPLLGIRFDLEEKNLVLYRPDGQRFQSYIELEATLNAERSKAEKLAAKLRELGIEPETLS